MEDPLRDLEKSSISLSNSRSAETELLVSTELPCVPWTAYTPRLNGLALCALDGLNSSSQLTCLVCLGRPKLLVSTESPCLPCTFCVLATCSEATLSDRLVHLVRPVRHCNTLTSPPPTITDVRITDSALFSLRSIALFAISFFLQDKSNCAAQNP